jgi:hypothetical protein
MAQVIFDPTDYTQTAVTKIRLHLSVKNILLSPIEISGLFF